MPQVTATTSAPNSKQALLIELIARPSGITLVEASKATGWQPHTVRATISAILKKRLGLNIVVERVAGGGNAYRLLGTLSPVNEQPQAMFAPHSAAARSPVQYSAGSPYTVAHAIHDYMQHYSREGKGVSIVTGVIDAHILPALGDIPTDKLTAKMISDWHNALSLAPARNRSRKAENATAPAVISTPDIIRRRRSTANRIMTVLKAALNYAWRSGLIDSDAAWRRVQAFRGVTNPIIRYLEEPECQRLVKACDTDLRLIVQAALFTGCRYGEIGRLVASDYRADTGTVHVKISKSGKPRHIILADEGKTFFEQTTKDKLPGELMFKTNSGRAWGKSLQSKKMRIACKRAGIEPPISYHILRHTYGSLLAMKGAPMTVVAKQLGHANTLVTEKHYAHISAGYVAQVVRESFPHLKIT